MTSEPLLYYFKRSGSIPNSVLPVVVYPKVFAERGPAGAEWLETRFASNNWSNAWRDSVFPYHHYHSNTHEVLGIYQGESILKLGGEDGTNIPVHAGDIIIIPAGVAHKKVEEKNSFRVVGAYPNGMSYDIKKGLPGEYKKALANLARVSHPKNDPVFGQHEGICNLWKDNG